MGFNQRLAERVKLAAQAQPKKGGFWESTLENISNGEVIPIVSGSFRLEQVFRAMAGELSEKTEMEGPELTVVEMLIKQWASLFEYPMQDDYNLARVVQYYLVEKLRDQKDEKIANKVVRSDIVNFLKTSLLAIAGDDADYSDVIAGLENQMDELSFSEMVRQLDYPRFSEPIEDPFRILARFPLKFYITTGQSDFMERALMAEDKEPRTQVCYWSGEPGNVLKEHRTDQNFEPSIDQPMVFHLFGLENYPETLVLSEDDYISFLISNVEDTNNQNPIVPLNLRKALGTSQLLLLGYRLYDWDFRVLFRFLLKFRIKETSLRGMLLQLKQKEDDPKTKKTLDYLGRYFDMNKFDIEWSDTGVFIQRLWQEWDTNKQRRQ